MGNPSKTREFILACKKCDCTTFRTSPAKAEKGLPDGTSWFIRRRYNDKAGWRLGKSYCSAVVSCTRCGHSFIVTLKKG